jgi:hypothetical protein
MECLVLQPQFAIWRHPGLVRLYADYLFDEYVALWRGFVDVLDGMTAHRSAAWSELR